MSNLFILHTQYNIILGASVLIEKYQDSQNDLIVYAEFKLSPEYKNHLEQVFNRVLYIRDEFKPLIIGFWNIEHHLKNEYDLFKNSEFHKTKYDNVFISQDRPLEHLILGRCKQINPKCECFDIEEGCYYSLTPQNNDPNRQRKWQTKRPFLYRKLRYGKLYYSEEYRCPIDGEASYFDGIYAIFPNLIRKELFHKHAYEVKSKNIIEAIQRLYSYVSVDIPYSKDYVLVFFDLMNRYKNKAAIKDVVEYIVNSIDSCKTTILLKYHPRETEKFVFSQANIIEIPSIIPAEKLLCDLHGKDVTVFGNATTSIIVAQKFGFKTISIAGIEGSNNIHMINKFREMGIEVPDSIEEIK